MPHRATAPTLNDLAPPAPAGLPQHRLPTTETLPWLPCPECLDRGIVAPGSRSRMGSRRNDCLTCNAFASRVRQRASRELARRHPDEYDRLRLRAERDIYVAVVEKFHDERPRTD